MPTLDDAFLDTVLHQVGDSFTVPSSGPSAILQRVHHDDDERAGRGRPTGEPGMPGERDEAGAATPLPLSRARAVRRTIRAHRGLTVAASVVILLLVAGGAVWFDNGTSTTTGTSAAGLKATPATHSSGNSFGANRPPSGSGKTAESSPTTPPL